MDIQINIERSLRIISAALDARASIITKMNNDIEELASNITNDMTTQQLALYNKKLSIYTNDLKLSVDTAAYDRLNLELSEELANIHKFSVDLLATMPGNIYYKEGAPVYDVPTYFDLEIIIDYTKLQMVRNTTKMNPFVVLELSNKIAETLLAEKDASDSKLESLRALKDTLMIEHQKAKESYSKTQTEIDNLNLDTHSNRTEQFSTLYKALKQLVVKKGQELPETTSNKADLLALEAAILNFKHNLNSSMSSSRILNILEIKLENLTVFHDEIKDILKNPSLPNLKLDLCLTDRIYNSALNKLETPYNSSVRENIIDATIASIDYIDRISSAINNLESARGIKEFTPEDPKLCLLRAQVTIEPKNIPIQKTLKHIDEKCIIL